ncbi:MAG: adenosylmethionine decarboxylase [Pseudomonadota bacterium]|nr:adenosylmethionine decarboxylase [Pseudomonadota bacterium]
MPRPTQPNTTTLTPALRTAEGVQLMVDLFECRGERQWLEQADNLRLACQAMVLAVGLTTVAVQFHQFEPVGVTGVVLLAESHLAIHTWPEHDFVSIDLYVCNFSADNSAKAEQLVQDLIVLFGSQAPNIQRAQRGRLPIAAMTS